MKDKRWIAAYVVGAVLVLLKIGFDFFSLRSSHEDIPRKALRLAQERREFQHRWLGVGVIQYPTDLMTYAELIYRTKPEVFVETGTNYGGLAVYVATLLEKINPDAKVITVDIDGAKWREDLPKIPKGLLQRIVFIEGDSVAVSTVEQISQHAQGKKGMVLLDSDHSRRHVEKELKLYSQFVAVNNYLIVNDTHLEILEVEEMKRGEGPLTASESFLHSNPEFDVDESLPGTIISCAPSGFLKRVRPPARDSTLTSR
jgi:cephalosporin hydroxylase